MKQKAFEGVLAGQIKNNPILLDHQIPLALREVVVFSQLVIRSLSRILMPFLFRLEKHSIDYADPRKPLIIISNHKSYFDPLVISNTLPFGSKLFPLWFIAKDQFFLNPISAWFFRTIGAFPTYYGHGLDKSLATALQILRNGETVVFFPEGKCIRQEELGQPKPGLANLVLQIPYAQILPMAIRNSYKIGTGRPTVKTLVGKPFILRDKLDFSNTTEDSITELLMQEIENLYRQI